MDGFDLDAQRARRSDARTDIPIIMITSRTAEKHRNQRRRARRRRLPRQALPGVRAPAADRRAPAADEVQSCQETIGKYPLMREIGSGRDQQVYLAARPVRRARRRDQGVPASTRGADAQQRAHAAQGVRRRGLARRQAQPPAHRRHLRRGGRAQPQLPRHGIRARQHARDALRRAERCCRSARWSRSSSSASRALEYALPARHHPSRHQARQHPAFAADGETKVQRLRRRVPAAAAGDHADHRRRLAGVHVARADPHGAAQRTRPTSTRSASPCTACSPGGCRSTRSTHAALTYAILNTTPPPPVDAAARAAGAARRDRDEGDRQGPGRALPVAGSSSARTSARPSPACAWPATSVSDSEKFTKLRDLPFFADFGDVALWEVVRIGTWKTIGRAGRAHPRGRDRRQLLLPGRGRGRGHAARQAARHHQARRAASASCSISPTARSGARPPSPRAARSPSWRSSPTPARRHRRAASRLQQGLHAGADRAARRFKRAARSRRLRSGPS